MDFAHVENVRETEQDANYAKSKYGRDENSIKCHNTRKVGRGTRWISKQNLNRIHPYSVCAERNSFNDRVKLDFCWALLILFRKHTLICLRILENGSQRRLVDPWYFLSRDNFEVFHMARGYFFRRNCLGRVSVCRECHNLWEWFAPRYLF